MNRLRIACMVFGLALILSPGRAAAQPAEPAKAPPLPRKTFTKNMVFNLPVQMDERTRALLRQVNLHVKRGSGPWELAESTSPDKLYFQFKCPADGEYLFGLVTVNRQGKSNPTNLDDGALLRVVVDTKPPEITAEIVKENGQSVLKVTAVDANLDKDFLQVAAILDDGDERILSPRTGESAFVLTRADLLRTIRITAMDLAGNIATRELALTK